MTDSADTGQLASKLADVLTTALRMRSAGGQRWRSPSSNSRPSTPRSDLRARCLR